MGCLSVVPSAQRVNPVAAREATEIGPWSLVAAPLCQSPGFSNGSKRGHQFVSRVFDVSTISTPPAPSVLIHKNVFPEISNTTECIPIRNRRCGMQKMPDAAEPSANTIHWGGGWIADPYRRDHKRPIRRVCEWHSASAKHRRATAFCLIPCYRRNDRPPNQCGHEPHSGSLSLRNSRSISIRIVRSRQAPSFRPRGRS